MIGPVEIRYYKSIRELKFDAKWVNVFIGEPNSGKSNIIEALACLSPGVLHDATEILRLKTTSDLFFDQNIKTGLSVSAGEWKLSLGFSQAGMFQGTFTQGQNARGGFNMGYQGNFMSGQPQCNSTLRYYAFKPLTRFPNNQPGVLNPPFGDNLVAILYTNEELRQKIGAIIRQKGFRLQLKPTENELLIAKDVNDELYSYPWTAVSETLRRIAFLMAVLETNRNSTLLLDEPETNTFPFYIKYVAERIALDESNQFFITTHNPYLLSSIVEKTPRDKLAVFVTRMEMFETMIKPIPEKKLPELLELDSDAFFNLDKLVEE